jgi:hypothetical protein
MLSSQLMPASQRSVGKQTNWHMHMYPRLNITHKVFLDVSIDTTGAKYAFDWLAASVSATQACACRSWSKCDSWQAWRSIPRKP